MGQRARPLLVYDGDCGFCRRWIERWREITAGRVDYARSQDVGAELPDVAPETFERAVVLVETDGAVYEGAEAVFRSLSHAPGGGRALAAYRRVPGFALVSELGYRVVASNRRLASFVTRALWGGEVREPRYQLTRWLFLRALGVVYLIAFASLRVQIDGLIGSEGILPAAPWAAAVARRHGLSALLQTPSILLLDASDPMLHAVCAAGMLASLLLVVNALPALAALAAWGLYLSLYTAGRTFLSFQWDVLLLETGFLAILLAPWQLVPRLRDRKPTPSVAILLLRWLLFRLMFLSGAVKLLSGDPAWSDLTALTYHYWTQPLPAWTSWYVHHLPLWVHEASCAIMFAIELVVPFLVFLPRRPRLVAFFAFVSLQLAIIATGNYGFFNLLSLILCIPLLDDAYLRRLLPARLGRAMLASNAPEPATSPRRLRPSSVLRSAAAVVLVVLSTVQFVGRLGYYERVPWQIRFGMEQVAAFHLTSSYGLFAVMTKRRPEIVIEGSDDARTWKAYEFRWKPGALDREPRFVAPHMPRLDWQMWFAALSHYRRQPWVMAFMGRLLEGSKPVLDLLAFNPFEDHPPRYVRAMVWDYRFADPETHRETGAWWVRSDPKQYAPLVSREAK